MLGTHLDDGRAQGVDVVTVLNEVTVLYVVTVLSERIDGLTLTQ